jgi:hypothetical protein
MVLTELERWKDDKKIKGPIRNELVELEPVKRPYLLAQAEHNHYAGVNLLS